MKSIMYQNILEQYDVLRNMTAGFSHIDLIRECNGRLFLIGTGASLNACYAAVRAIFQLSGKYPIVLAATEADQYMSAFGSNDVVVLISQSGDSFETKKLCKELNDKDICFFGITNSNESTLAKSANIPILLNAGEEVSSATKTHTASMLALYLLAAQSNYLPKFDRLVENVKSLLNQMPMEIDKLAVPLHDCSPAYVLTDNLNYASARQAALLLKEKCRLCVEGMTVSEFRHGAVEVAEPGMKALLILTEESFFNEAEKHMAFLNSLGVELYLIATREFEGIPQERTVVIPAAAEECFSPLLVTIPLQFMAERAAELNGFDVDGFRYLSKIVGNY